MQIKSYFTMFMSSAIFQCTYNMYNEIQKAKNIRRCKYRTTITVKIGWSHI